MSDEGTPIADEAVLRLERCPQCDYSLEALPLEGICPECGGPYDQAFLIYTGRGRGRFDSLMAGTWRGMIWAMICVAFAAWIFSDLRNAKRHPFMLAFAGVSLLMVLAQVYARFISGAEPRMQIWMSTEGVAQRTSTSEARSAQWFMTWISVLYVPTVFVIMLATGTSWRSGAFLSLIGTFAVLLAVSFWGAMRERRHYQTSVRQSSVLHPWTRIEKSRITAIDKKRARIRLDTSIWFGPIRLSEEPVVDIEVELASPRVDRLRAQVESWIAQSRSKEPAR